MNTLKEIKLRLTEIFLGLMHGIKVSKYAKFVFSSEQMREIREGLEVGIDVSLYSNPRGKNFRDQYLNAESMRIIKDALIAGVDIRIIEMWKESCCSYRRKFELSEISICAERGIDISKMLDQGYDGEQIDFICRVLVQHPEWEEILFNNINPQMKCYVIKFIVYGLTYKSDISNYHKLAHELTYEQARNLVMWHKKGFDITKYIQYYSYEQIENIYLGKANDVDITIYENDNFNAQQMREIRLGLEDGLDVSIYADKKYNHAQMKVIRKGLLAKVDVSIYANPKMSQSFMREVLEALLVLQKAATYKE